MIVHLEELQDVTMFEKGVIDNTKESKRNENGRKQRSESSWWHECQEKTKGETKREMDACRPKGYTGTADYPGENILEIKNLGHWPHLVEKGEEVEESS